MMEPKNESFKHKDFWSILYLILNIKQSFVNTESKVVQEDMWVNVGMDRHPIATSLRVAIDNGCPPRRPALAAMFL